VSKPAGLALANGPPVAIRTPRLELDPFGPDEARALLDGERRDHWASDYPTDGDVEIAHFIAANPASWVGPYVPYKVVVLYSGLVIGGCGFFGPPDTDGLVEIGYGLAPSHRGMGFATESVQGLLTRAWQDPGVRTVFATTDADNAPSHAVLQRAGFRQVASESEQFRWEIGRP
jgi:ribosomal-protein-alanine N-acetyltransferase